MITLPQLEEIVDVKLKSSTSIPAPELSSLVKLLLDLVEDSNIQVSLSATELLADVIGKAGRGLRSDSIDMVVDRMKTVSCCWFMH